MARIVSGIPLEDASAADVAYEFAEQTGLSGDFVIGALAGFIEHVGIGSDLLADYLTDQHDADFGTDDEEDS